MIGRALRVCEILDAQAQLYYDLGVNPPTSLWVGGNTRFTTFSRKSRRSECTSGRGDNCCRR